LGVFNAICSALSKRSKKSAWDNLYGFPNIYEYASILPLCKFLDVHIDSLVFNKKSISPSGIFFLSSILLIEIVFFYSRFLFVLDKLLMSLSISSGFIKSSSNFLLAQSAKFILNCFIFAPVLASDVLNMEPNPHPSFYY